MVFLQAPPGSFLPSAWGLEEPKAARSAKLVPLVLVRGVQARPAGSGHKEEEAFALQPPPAPEKADRLAAALKRLWTLGRGSADSRAHYGLLVSGSAWPKVHSAGY